MAMSSYSAIIGLSEAASGYSGGSATDYYPGLSLTEATSGFTNALISWGIENNAATQEYNAKISNLMVEAAQYGAPLDEAAIINEAFGKFGEKVKQFFERIKKWIKSIIAKLHMFIDKLTMSGRNLASKYGEQVKKKANNGELKGMTFMGYKFVADIAGAYRTKLETCDSADSAHAAMKVSTGDNSLMSIEDYKTKFADSVSDSNKAEAESMKKKISDCSEEKQIDNLLKEITGLSKGTGWKASLKKAFYGSDEKVELTFSSSGDYGKGSNTFSATGVVAALENPEEFKEMEQAYEEFQHGVEKQEQAFRTVADTFENTNKETLNSSDTSDGASNKRAGINACINYADAYIGALDNIYKAQNMVKDAKISAIKDRNSQAKAIFSKMLSYKDTSSNSDFSDEFVDSFGFDGFGQDF